MNTVLETKLKRLAAREMRHSAAAKDYTEEIGTAKFSFKAYELAFYALGVDSEANLKVLSAFCEDNAVELLERLPNTYWLWRIVSGALDFNRPQHSRISKAAVLSSIAAERKTASERFDLTSGVEYFNPSTAANFTAYGIIVISAGSCLLERNLVFDSDKLEITNER